MDRLTGRYSNGVPLVLNCTSQIAKRMFDVVDKLAHYEDLAEQGLLVGQQHKTGDWVYVVERDEDGEACEVFGYIFIASCRNAVIVSPKVNGSDDVDDLLGHQITETVMQHNGDLPVFPKEDCYATKEEAEAKLAEEGGGSDE